MYDYGWIGHLALIMTHLTTKKRSSAKIFKNNIHCWLKARRSHQKGVPQNSLSTLMLKSFRKYIWRSLFFRNVTSCRHAPLLKMNSFICFCSKTELLHSYFRRILTTDFKCAIFENTSQWLLQERNDIRQEKIKLYTNKQIYKKDCLF